MRKYWWLVLVPAMALVWWIIERGDAPVQAHFASVREATIQSTVPTNGKVEPVQWAAARAQTSGVVQSISVQRGQRVNAGQTLIALDATSSRADLAAALAREQEAEAALTTLGQGGRASAVANLNDSIQAARNAVSVAQRVYDADQRLLQNQAITKLQAQADADALERAKLNLSALENQRRVSVTASDRVVAEARLRDAREAVRLAQHRSSLSQVVSPMTGTIYAFDLKVGAYLEPGSLVANVGDIDKMKVVVNVDEPDLGRVGLGMPVVITWEGLPDKKWWGKVDKLPTEVIPLGTRSVGQVSTIIDNPDRDLLPGVSVNATIVSKVVKNALAVPKASLHRLAGRDGVYKLENGTAHWTKVTTGISDINNVEILSGLQRGDRVMDRVIEPGDAEIKDRMRVKAVLD